MPHEKPLKLPWLHILLALADEDRHGYGIQREVLEQTDEGLMLWPAMLYRSLNTLTEAGFVEPVDDPVGAPLDERRQYYHLTAYGRRRLSEQLTSMQSWINAAQTKGLRVRSRPA